MSIKIKILSNNEFERLPSTITRGADISQSIGFADTERKAIYVRDTGIDPLNKYLIDHELEHLFEAEGTDVDSEVPVIRHKFFSALLPAIMGAAKAGGGALVSGAKAGGGALLSGAKSLGTGTLGAAKGAGSFLKGTGKSLMSSFTPQASAGAAGVNAIGQAAPAAASPLTSFGTSATAPMAVSAAAPVVPTAMATAKQVGGSSLLSSFDKLSGGQLLGTALLGGGLMKPLPQAPQLPSSVPQLASQIQSGGSDLGRLG